MRSFNRGVIFIAAAALLTAATAMPGAARSEQGAVAAKAYYPAAGNDTWEKKRPEEVGMDPKALAAAIELAKASDNKREFSLNPREYIEKRTAEEGSGELLGPFRERTTINGVVLRHGYIVAEFGDTLKPDMTFSVAKSFVSTTVGLAFDAGLIKNVDDPRRPVRQGRRLRQPAQRTDHLAAVAAADQRMGRHVMGQARHRGSPARQGSEARKTGHLL